MKALHRPDMFSWSVFDAPRNVDFHGHLIVREGGNVVVDPMPLSDHDLAHLDALGGAAWIVVTNSDHLRSTVELAAHTGAKVAAPAAESGSWDGAVDRWLKDGDTLVPGVTVLTVDGSKTAGELVVRVENTLIMGDLVRAHQGGRLNILPAPKLRDPAAAVASVARLAALDGIDAVLVGDGWPVFRDGGRALCELAASLA